MISIFIYDQDSFGRRSVMVENSIRDELCRRLADRNVARSCAALHGQVKIGLTSGINHFMDFDLVRLNASGLDAVADAVAELRAEGFVESDYDSRLRNNEPYFQEVAQRWRMSVVALMAQYKLAGAQALEVMETFLREKSALMVANPSLNPGRIPAPVDAHEFDWGEWEVGPANLTANRECSPLGSPPTLEELERPRKGSIQKLFLRDVLDARTQVASVLQNLPVESPWYRIVSTWLLSVEKLAHSLLQFLAVERIRAMAKVFLAYEAGELPQGFHEPLRHMKRLGRTIGHAITLHIMDNDGAVDAKLLEWFITCFSVRGFTEETGGDEVVEEYRVDRAVTVDAAGIMILAPAEVVARLQTQPWPRAQQFLGGKAWAEAFGRYAPGGQSLPVLQNRYAADGTTIVARWNELAAWVEAQRSAEHA